MRGGLEIMTVKGVPVRVHTSLVVVAVLLVLLAIGEAESGADAARRLMAPLILVLTVVLHEVGHALAALGFGIRVVDIVLTPFGGMARLEGSIEDGRKEALVSAAGPATNLLVAGATWALLAATDPQAIPGLREIFLIDVPDDVFYADRPLLALLGFNLMLGVLNLLPAFPMDGGRILRGALAVRRGRLAATRTAFRASTWIALGMIALPFLLTLTGAGAAHWWVAPFIGIFVLVAALKERLVVEAKEGLMAGSGFGFRVFTQRGGSRETPARDDREPDGFIDVEGESRRIGRDDDRPSA